MKNKIRNKIWDKVYVQVLDKVREQVVDCVDVQVMQQFSDHFFYKVYFEIKK